MKKFSLYVMSGVYVAAGLNHFVHSGTYKAIMPPWLSWHDELILISGVCEVVFGLLLIPGRTRRVGAWCIIGLLIAVFPANIQMMINYRHLNHPLLWLSILRLPLQVVLIWWAYLFAKPQRGQQKQ